MFVLICVFDDSEYYLNICLFRNFIFYLPKSEDNSDRNGTEKDCKIQFFHIRTFFNSLCLTLVLYVKSTFIKVTFFLGHLP